MSSSPYSAPVHSLDAQIATAGASTDARANASTSRRLEDRVAEFLQSFESSSPQNFCLPRFGQNISTSEAVEATLLTQSTADPVQTQSQVVNCERADIAHLSSDTVSMIHLQTRGKRSRRKAQVNEEIIDLSDLPVTYGTQQQLPRSQTHPSHTSYAPMTTLSLMQYPASAVLRSTQDLQMGPRPSVPEVGSSDVQRTVGVSFHNQMAVMDFDKSNSASGSHRVVSQASSSDRPHSDGIGRVNELEKARRDWETHITVMEQVLVANKAQGLPMGAISSEALQLLSQMVSDLYTLNSKLLCAETQNILDAHRKNIERINNVFQGLSGVPQHRDFKKDN